MRLPTVTVLFLAASVVVWPASSQEDVQPVDSGIVEQTERRLMQIDVTVRGPAATIEALTATDFSLTVGRENIHDFVLDRLCIDSGVEGLDLNQPEIAESLPRLRTLFYFDQTHLTSSGRRRSIDLARELIPELLSGGRSEAMIVSASHRLEVSATWSDDTGSLLAALDELENNPEQRSTWADEEDTRVARLMTAIERMNEFSQEATREYNRNERDLSRSANRGGGLGSGTRGQFTANLRRQTESGQSAAGAQASARLMARVAARNLQREESTRTAASLSLFNIALQQLNDVAPPKSVVYFADTMRSNAGDFYVAMVNSSEQKHRLDPLSQTVGRPSNEPVKLSSGNYLSEFQEAIDLATEKGVRFYTIQGRGLFNQTLARTRIGSASMNSLNPLLGRSRFRDAESALGGLASETGGKSFLWAADADRIAGQILDDLSCLFVFSFHAVQLKEDRRTSVWIDVDRPGVELKYRPRVIALSERNRARERLAGAFWGSGQRDNGARVVALPTGFDKGKYTVLVQFAIPGSGLAAGAWDMGVTAVVGRSRTIKAAGRVSVNQPDLPMVFETEMRIPPGDFTITGAAKSTDLGELISTRLDGRLPDPNEAEPFVASIAMLQRTPGAFVRGDTTRKLGSLGFGPDHWINPGLPTGILTLVCGSRNAKAVTAGRSLEGATEVWFDEVELDFDRERCGLLVDMIDRKVLTSGRFSYAVDLNRDSNTIADQAREFLVVTREEIELARKRSPGQDD